MFHNSRERFMNFSDGVFAVILTVLVLEIKPPTGDLNIFSSSWRTFGYSVLIYIASFSLVSTYWFFHQKLFSSVRKITETHMILNFYFLFFISLMPLLTQLIAENPLSRLNNLVYALVYLVFNIYLWWLFKETYATLVKAFKWTEIDLRAATKEIQIISGTIVVAVIACIGALIWGPLSPIILATSPLVRDWYKWLRIKLTTFK